MERDGTIDGRDSGRKKMGSGFRWVSLSPSPEEVASLEAAFSEVIHLPVAELEAEMEGWQMSAILVRSYYKWVPAAALIREFRRAGIQGEIAPISLAFRCHIIRFEDPKACELVLNRPWVVNGQVIGTEQWRPEFIPAEDAISSALVWVRLPNLPMEFWKEEFLRDILAPAGQLISVDASTLAKSRGGFARACLRVNLLQPLKPGTRVQGINLPFWQQFAFENMEGICYSCGSLHLKGPCSQSSGSGDVGAASFTAFGPWIAALRQRREVPSSQRFERRSAQSLPMQGSSGSGPGSQTNRAAPVGATGVSEGWSLPMKVARRRIPLLAKGVVNSGKGSRGSEEILEEGISARGVVPGQGGRAGIPSAETVVMQEERAGSVLIGSSEERKTPLLNTNPFASLGLLSGDGGLLDNRDAFPGPLKRARPVDCQAPRLISKSEKRKGKGKAVMSKRPGVCFLSPDRLTLPSFSQEGGKEVEMSYPDRAVGFSVEVIDSDDTAMGSGTLAAAQSPRASVVSEGPEAGSSLNAEGGIPSHGCQSDTAMVEDQEGVPVSSSL